ncbi:hypothetical protein FRB99_007237 [Tulasnella sp. 403]|nr:hypothetical protein FRB99_007237 [Tulasnella sp. 403]
MDIDPPLFKRKKSRPSRLRETHTAVDEEEAHSTPPIAEVDESPMALATKLKTKQKTRSKLQAKLSFDVDEGQGAETFKVKKSELSTRMKKGMSPSPLAVHVPTIEVPQTQDSAPTYTSEYLSQLKAENALHSTRPAASPGLSNMQDVQAYNADELEAMGVEDAFDTVSFEHPKLHGRYTTETELKSMPDIANAIQGGTAVAEAKRKRERLRAIGVSTVPSSSGRDADEFISLSLTKVPKDTDVSEEGPHPESRLMREEDDLGDGEDELANYTGAKERVALGKKSQKAEAKRRRAGMLEMIEDAEHDDDEETREWEMQQIRRNEAPEDRAAARTEQKSTYKAAPIPDIVSLPTLATSISQLTDTLNALTASHTGHTASLTSLGDERATLEEKETDLRKMVEAAEIKRAWFKDMREWIESVADFLDTKFPLLERLEEEHISLLNERYGMVSKRREEDDEDDACLFLTLPPKPSQEAQQDDLGRISAATQQGPHAPVRKARRADRERRHATRLGSEEDGFSTDSDLPPSDAEDFEDAMRKLRQRVKALLSDVQLREFKEARLAVAQRFSDWRSTYEESYTNAWGGLGAVAAWEFWARFEMAGWDPLRDERNLDSFDWYTGLYEYSRPRPKVMLEAMDVDDDEDDALLGPDGDLVTSMITTAVIPRLNAVISGGAFDPYSMRHIRRVVDLAEQVELCTSKDDPKFLIFAQTVTKVLTNAVNSTWEIVDPALRHPRPSTFEPAALHARLRFLSRRFKLLTVTLKWRKHIGERFGIGQTVERLVEGVMEPIARDGWDVGGEKVMQRASASILIPTHR